MAQQHMWQQQAPMQTQQYAVYGQQAPQQYVQQQYMQQPQAQQPQYVQQQMLTPLQPEVPPQQQQQQQQSPRARPTYGSGTGFGSGSTGLGSGLGIGHARTNSTGACSLHTACSQGITNVMQFQEACLTDPLEQCCDETATRVTNTQPHCQVYASVN